MKKNETRMWINYHREVFPDWKYAPESPAAKAIAFDAACKALSRTDLADAKTATDRILGGQCKKPFHDEDHIAAVISEAGRLASERRQAARPQKIEGQETFRCPLCLDTGYVECWRRDLIHKMAVACSCDRGAEVAKGNKSRNGPMPQRYDQTKCFRVGDTSDYWRQIAANLLAENGVDKTAVMGVQREQQSLAGMLASFGRMPE